MRTQNFARNLNWVWVLVLAAFFTACSQMDGIEPDSKSLEGKSDKLFRLNPFGNGLENAKTASSPISDGGITPDIIEGSNPGGNRTCDEVATAYSNADRTVTFSNSFDQINAVDFDENTATFGAITATTDGTYVSWTIDVPAGYCVKYVAAVVKGSNDANVYFYEGDVRSDSGLAPPMAGGSGDPAELSNLRFCYTLEPCEDEPCFEWKGETATGDGNRFANSSNWFMWNNYTTDPIKLIAGQNMEAGSIQMGPISNENITITITLDEGWRFKTVGETIVSDAVKVLAYLNPPTSFNGFGNDVRNIRYLRANFNGDVATITVPAAGSYFIHVDVEWEKEIECPVDED
ncbi:hypothetical protein [Cecembia rubra]|uniref:hypothetical protein n=1 Tax=Cecembia rubra TaxID=1485585 RepID=UPI0027150695|nr:hypothetical protein [Cecembia rubra]